MELYEIVFMLTGVILALGAVSYFFFGNSRWFSTAEHVYLGGNVAVILSGDVQSLITSGFQQIAAGRFLLIIPMVIGLLAFTRWTRYRWSARYPTALLSGIGVGLMIGLQVRSSIVSMVSETVLDVVLGRPDKISGIVVLAGFISVIIYYLYSRTLSGPVREGRFKFLSKIGTYFLLLTSGYLYSQIYMVEGIDLLSGNFILWFRRSIEEINLYMATHSSAVLGSTGLPPSSIPAGIAFNSPLAVIAVVGAVAVAGIGSLAYVKWKQKSRR